ncbi:hypothetical protein BV898_07132 [Hypsibius exemplaris]|uniref:Casein kinase substrate phosphoprotein PP28 domain-containing protein n=1 Tax=Hypsibius exemplaris TaxID=2072580 RepID=A0A1W0WUJ1_HYPEX|nr:hypothetical protein BV898_07132 [Hypsibius exemplaris]
MPKGAREGGKPAAVAKAQRSAKKGTQKGKTRHFTSPEELAAQAAQLDIEREGGDRIRERKAEGSGEESDETSSSGSESESSDEEVEKTKGVSALIEIENPNRVAVKNKKISELTIDTSTAGTQLSRREREEIEKESAKKLHEQLRAEGKTEQARADLARLAIIREEREQAAKKRAAEQTVKDAARASKAEATPSLKKDTPAGSGKK